MSEIEAVAKATEEVAKTAGKSVDASVGLGRFLERTFGDAFREAGGLAYDRVRYWRVANLLKFQARYEALLAQHGITAEPAALPLKFSLPLIEAASVEEEDELQDLFAKLLFNTADAPSKAEARRAFVSLLQEMNAFDVRVLFSIAQAPDAKPRLYPTRTVYTAWLPDEFITSQEEGGKLLEPPEDVALALNNLTRLGCVVPSGVWDGAVSFGLVTFTALGQALVAACTVAEPKTSPEPQ